MKIQLASTLPFTPLQLDPNHSSPRRSVGQLQGLDNNVEYRLPVYEFRHEEELVYYKVDLSERVNVEQEGSVSNGVDVSKAVSATQDIEWIEHTDSLSYKPYAFVVMNAMTKLVADWDGVVYRTPSGERLRESAFQATLQVIDACVSPQTGLWVMVNLQGDTVGSATMSNAPIRQMGWVPVACQK